MAKSVVSWVIEIVTIRVYTTLITNPVLLIRSGDVKAHYKITLRNESTIFKTASTDE